MTASDRTPESAAACVLADDLHEACVSVGAVLMALSFLPEGAWTAFHHVAANSLGPAHEKLLRIEEALRAAE